MAFAKMQTPQTLRESYLLTDPDVETIREGEDASVGGPEPDVEEVRNSLVAIFQTCSFFIYF